MVRNHHTIIGVKIDSISTKRVLSLVSSRLKVTKKSKSPLFIVTPNPEIILAAKQDSQLRKILNDADISICDGIGISLVSKFIYGQKIKRLAGRKLFESLLILANDKSLKVFLLGSTDQVIQKTISRIRTNFPNIKIYGDGGPILNKDAEPASAKDHVKQSEVLKKVKTLKPDILFIAFGAPKQEKWGTRYKKMLNTKVVMVVGGTLDYYSGNKSLPPEMISRLGLEWLWRLTHEKGHLKRVFNALIAFPLVALRDKFL